LAKVITYDASREDARRKLVAALRRTTVLGVSTNKAFLAELCAHPIFVAGETTTAFIPDHFASLHAVTPTLAEWALAALAFLLAGSPHAAGYPAGWRNGAQIPGVLKLGCGEARITATLALDRRHAGMRYDITLGGDALTAEVESWTDGTLVARIDGVRREL